MKLLIANRGEIAVRIARTCRVLGVPTVAVFSDVDAGALHVRACDEAVRIGGAAPADSYLRIDLLLDAARRSGADAVHPGYGFLSENPAFAKAVVDAGLTWVGPPADVIAAMGDKLEARRRAAAAGLPVLPGVEVGEGKAPDASAIGFPAIVKAAAGGGGRGMRLVHDAARLPAALVEATREAQSAFGDGRVYVERYVARPHHLEVQLLGDAHGNLVHLFERECSIQRRHQKIVEEAPAPRLAPELRAALCDAAVKLGRSLGYRSAGTVEFVAEEQDGEITGFWFLEVNTRLQVEHPVTESVVRVRGAAGPRSLDLVALQLAVARGERLPFGQADLVTVGHAIEARLYAEDPRAGHRPSPGRLADFAPPTGTAVRWDSGVEPGSDVPSAYDPLLAKAIAVAPTRAEAATALARALERTLISGVVTNRDLLVGALRDPVFLEGRTTTHFLEERELLAPPSPSSVLRAAIVAAVREVTAGSFAGAPGIPPRFSTGPLPWPPARFGELEVTVLPRRDGFEVRAAGESHDVRLAGDDLELDGVRIPAVVSVQGDRVHVMLPEGQVDLSRSPRFPAPDAAEAEGACVAPMPGRVVEVAVVPAAAIGRGDLLVVIEAMKMEHRITAPHDGVVVEVRVKAQDQVGHGEVLVVLAPPPVA